MIVLFDLCKAKVLESVGRVERCSVGSVTSKCVGSFTMVMLFAVLNNVVRFVLSSKGGRRDVGRVALEVAVGRRC